MQCLGKHRDTESRWGKYVYTLFVYGWVAVAKNFICLRHRRRPTKSATQLQLKRVGSGRRTFRTHQVQQTHSHTLIPKPIVNIGRLLSVCPIWVPVCITGRCYSFVFHKLAEK